MGDVHGGMTPLFVCVFVWCLIFLFVVLCVFVWCYHVFLCLSICVCLVGCVKLVGLFCWFVVSFVPVMWFIWSWSRVCCGLRVPAHELPTT